MSLFLRKRKKMIYFSRNGVMILSCFIVMFLFILNTNLWPETPLPGHWEGTTNRGYPVLFDVSTDSTQWSNFELTSRFDSSYCGGSATITIFSGPGIISSGTFTYSRTGYSHSGNFTSPTTATGTYIFNNYQVVFPSPYPPYICYDYFSESGTWTASIELPPKAKDDLIGTWDGQGVYYRNSDTGGWVEMALPATQITCGDLDGDSIDDLIGVWPVQGGVWVKYSSISMWTRITSTADWIGAGDMNGDGRVDFLGTWSGQGVYYMDVMNMAWVQVATPATQITAGDIDGDGTDDLIGIWPAQGGVWVKYSNSGSWSRLSSTADWIGAGDMNGDGRCDLVGTWTGQGVYYRDSQSGSWVKLATPATMTASGDLDGDGTDDLIGIWPAQGGVWVKYSSDGTWEKLSSTADWIAAGKMRDAGGSGSEVITLSAPVGGIAEGPNIFEKHKDLSNEGPGGWNFVFQVEKNLAPKEKEPMRIMWIPGPGEPGFRCVEQKNLFPQERIEKKKKIRRK